MAGRDAAGVGAAHADGGGGGEAGGGAVCGAEVVSPLVTASQTFGQRQSKKGGGRTDLRTRRFSLGMFRSEAAKCAFVLEAIATSGFYIGSDSFMLYTLDIALK